jgi:hypothetical protein
LIESGTLTSVQDPVTSTFGAAQTVVGIANSAIKIELRRMCDWRKVRQFTSRRAVTNTACEPFPSWLEQQNWLEALYFSELNNNFNS